MWRTRVDSSHTLKTAARNPTKCFGEKDAQMCIYDASWDTHFGFCCDIDEETSYELTGILAIGVVTKAQIVGNYQAVVSGKPEHSLPTGSSELAVNHIDSKLVMVAGVVLMVVGAGRGPLVRASLQAAEETGRKLRVYAVEKNPNAIVTLHGMNDRVVPPSMTDFVQRLLPRGDGTRQAFTPEQINEACYVDINSNKAVFDSLRNNPKVNYDGRCFAYKSKHALKDKNQLLILIRKFPEGIAVIDLKDAYPTVMEDLQ
ncbi:unnamed protein product [Camellia sinensis]